MMRPVVLMPHSQFSSTIAYQFQKGCLRLTMDISQSPLQRSSIDALAKPVALPVEIRRSQKPERSQIGSRPAPDDPAHTTLPIANRVGEIRVGESCHAFERKAP